MSLRVSEMLIHFLMGQAIDGVLARYTNELMIVLGRAAGRAACLICSGSRPGTNGGFSLHNLNLAFRFSIFEIINVISLAYPFRWNKLRGLPETGAFAQKCDVPFATLARPKSNQNPKKIKKDP